MRVGRAECCPRARARARIAFIILLSSAAGLTPGRSADRTGLCRRGVVPALPLRLKGGFDGVGWGGGCGRQRGGSTSGVLSLRVLRGGRLRVRVGKRWIDPRKIANITREVSPEPDPALDPDSLNITLVPAWTEEGQQMLNFGDDIDDDGRPVVEDFIYQTPRRILNYSAFLQQETPRIANTRLWHAAELGEDDEIRLVAAYLDADVNSSNILAFNFTAMHWAALHGHSSTVKLLASMGADLNACDAFGSRPLHYAADAGHVGVVRLLLRLGARAYAENQFGRTALEWALDPLRWPGYLRTAGAPLCKSASNTTAATVSSNTRLPAMAGSHGAQTEECPEMKEQGVGVQDVVRQDILVNQSGDSEKAEEEPKGEEETGEAEMRQETEREVNVGQRDMFKDAVMTPGRWECIQELQKHMSLDLVPLTQGAMTPDPVSLRLTSGSGGDWRHESAGRGLSWAGLSGTAEGLHVEMLSVDSEEGEAADERIGRDAAEGHLAPAAAPCPPEVAELGASRHRLRRRDENSDAVMTGEMQLKRARLPPPRPPPPPPPPPPAHSSS